MSHTQAMWAEALTSWAHELIRLPVCLSVRRLYEFMTSLQPTRDMKCYKRHSLTTALKSSVWVMLMTSFMHPTHTQAMWAEAHSLYVWDAWMTSLTWLIHNDFRADNRHIDHLSMTSWAHESIRLPVCLSVCQTSVWVYDVNTAHEGREML